MRHLLSVVIAATLFAQQPAVKGITATRLFSGPDGQTHAEEFNLSQATQTKQGSPLPALLKSDNIRFAARAAGTSDEWHTAPRKQYLVTLKGHAEVEIGGGQIVHATTGSVLLIEDTTGKGHRAKVVGTDEWHVLFIPLAEK